MPEVSRVFLALRLASANSGVSLRAVLAIDPTNAIPPPNKKIILQFNLNEITIVAIPKAAIVPTAVYTVSTVLRGGRHGDVGSLTRLM